MELRNEPNVSQRLLLKRLAIVSSVFTVVLAVVFFSLGNLGNSSRSKASGSPQTHTISSNMDVDDDDVEDIFEEAEDGDTIKITAILRMEKDNDQLEDKDVIIVIDGGEIKWTKKRDLELSGNTIILLRNGGELTSDPSDCHKHSRIYFDDEVVVSCNGEDADYSFADVNDTYGISSSGLITTQSSSSSSSNYIVISGDIDDNEDKLEEAEDGDTILIEEPVYMEDDCDELEDVDVVILIDGSELKWTKKKDLKLSSQSKIVLINGGQLTSDDSDCHKHSRIYFDDEVVVSCNGEDADYSFADINAAGGVNANGALSSTTSNYIEISGNIDDDDVEDKLEDAEDGDTIKVVGDLYIDDDHDELEDKDVVIIVDNCKMKWTSKCKLELSDDSKIILQNGGELEAENGDCHKNTCIYFGDEKIVSCNGQDADHSFAQVNQTGSVSKSGISALPVELVRFDVERNNQVVDLYWSTASEINNSHFEVQRSLDLSEWEVIGEVMGHGNASHIIHYAFTDFDVPAADNIYYRLRQVDYDGAFEFSGVQVISSQRGQAGLKIFPNPANERVNIKVAFNSPYQLTIKDLSGRVIMNTQTKFSQVETIPTRDFPSGVYFALIEAPGIQESQKFIIRH